MNQWHVATLQPPHLAAMCIWEGSADWYRDMTHHGGILSTFWENWFDMQVKTVQYGVGERGGRSRVHGELVCGPETLSEEELAKNRVDFGGNIRKHPLDDKYHRDRSPVWAKVVTPLFSAANWGGQGLHPRGNFEGFVRAASQAEMAGGARHRALDAFLHRLRPRAAAALLRLLPARQERRLAQAAEGAAAGAPPGREIRRARRERMADQAHAMDQVLSRSGEHGAERQEAVRQSAQLKFAAMGDGLTFLTPPLRTGHRDHRPVGAQAVRLVVHHGRRLLHRAARVHRRSEGSRVPGRDRSAHADRARLAARLAPQARQETVDALPALSHPRPEAAAEEGPGRWNSISRSGRPRSRCRPAIASALSIRGKDYEYGGASGGKLSNFKNELTGCGPFLHNDPRDRPPAIFNGTTSLHFGRGKAPYLLLPIIPPKKQAARQEAPPQIARSATASWRGIGEHDAPRNHDKWRLRPFRGFTPTQPKVSFAQPST